MSPKWSGKIIWVRQCGAFVAMQFILFPPNGPFAYQFYCNPGNQSKNKLKTRGIRPCDGVRLAAWPKWMCGEKLIENEMNSAGETISDFDFNLSLCSPAKFMPSNDCAGNGSERRQRRIRIRKIIAKTFNIGAFVYICFNFEHLFHFPISLISPSGSRTTTANAQCIQANVLAPH